MKKLIVALMVLSTLASCGKDNKVKSPAAPAVVTNPSTTVSTTDANGVALADKITNYTTQFGVGQIIYYGNYATWGQLVNNALPLNFKYTESTSTTTANGQNCETKWSIFTVCSYSSSTSSTSSLPVSRTVQSNNVNVASKQDELRAIINSRNPLIPIQISGTSYRIQATDGKQYVIDTRFPLQANPIGIRKTVDGQLKTEYLFNIVEAQ